MSAPEPDDPQDAVVAKQYKENQSDYNAQAKFWTETYATGEGSSGALKAMLEMGLDEAQCRKALDKHNGNQEHAINAIFNGEIE